MSDSWGLDWHNADLFYSVLAPLQQRSKMGSVIRQESAILGTQQSSTLGYCSMTLTPSMVSLVILHYLLAVLKLPTQDSLPIL